MQIACAFVYLKMKLNEYDGGSSGSFVSILIQVLIAVERAKKSIYLLKVNALK